MTEVPAGTWMPLTPPPFCPTCGERVGFTRFEGNVTITNGVASGVFPAKCGHDVLVASERPECQHPEVIYTTKISDPGVRKRCVACDAEWMEPR